MNKTITEFAIIADPHYYSETLGNSGKAYMRREGSDQKMLAKSKGTIKSALDHIKNSDAKFLLIAGDLSNDGERVSHEEMREILYDFKKIMPVYVITSTHDWCCDENPRRYEDDKILHDVPTVPVGELAEFYRDFGLNDAVSKFHTHQNKVSYVVRPCEGVSVFCLDDDQNKPSDQEGFASGYSEEHFSWIKEQVALAKQRGDVVFGMAHHHLLLTEFDRVINGNVSVMQKEKQCHDFADIGFSVTFTGHSHMQHIRRTVSEKGNHFYEINVGSISGYPAPIMYGKISTDGIDLKTHNVEKFFYNGDEYSLDYLKNHATSLFSGIIDAAATNEKSKFSALLEAVSVENEKADKIWLIARPLLKWLNKLTVKKAARILNFISLGKAIDKNAAKEIKDVKVKDMVFSAFHSILDGSLEKHPEGTAYYTVFTQALAFPLKLVTKLKIKNGGLIRTLTHIKNASHEIMTGGPLDNNEYFVEF